MTQKTRIFLTLALALTAGGSRTSAASESPVVELPSPVNAVFVPKGFDSNDNALVVVSGTYPNSCYKMGPAKVTYDKRSRNIWIDVKTYYTTGVVCAALYIPYTQAVDVGVLQPGDYKVVVNQKEVEKLPIATTTRDQPDDFVYATVSSLSRISPDIFEIQGYLPNNCSQISEIRVLEEAGDVIAVLPMVSFGKNCEPSLDPKELSFKTEFKVSTGLQGERLIHVRSLNGASLNQVVTF